MFYCIPKSNVKTYYNFISQIHTSYEWRNFVEYMTLFRSPVILIWIAGVFLLCKRRIFMEKFKYSLLVLFGACSYGVLSTIFKLGFINGFSAHQLLGGQYIFGWIGLLLLVLFVSRHKVTKKAILFLTNSWYNDEYDRYLLRYFCRRTTSIYRCRPTFSSSHGLVSLLKQLQTEHFQAVRKLYLSLFYLLEHCLQAVSLKVSDKTFPRKV